MNEFKTTIAKWSRVVPSESQRIPYANRGFGRCKETINFKLEKDNRWGKLHYKGQGMEYMHGRGENEIGNQRRCDYKKFQSSK